MRGSRKRTRFGREKIEIADCYNRREGFGRAFLFWFFMLVLVLLGGGFVGRRCIECGCRRMYFLSRGRMVWLSRNGMGE